MLEIITKPVAAASSLSTVQLMSASPVDRLLTDSPSMMIEQDRSEADGGAGDDHPANRRGEFHAFLVPVFRHEIHHGDDVFRTGVADDDGVKAGQESLVDQA
jgi:hypothetical protein